MYSKTGMGHLQAKYFDPGILLDIPWLSQHITQYFHNYYGEWSTA